MDYKTIMFLLVVLIELDSLAHNNSVKYTMYYIITQQCGTYKLI